jgi:hypothetical protein
MPVRDAIATIQRDPKWKSKVGIGLLVNLVPYVGMFALRGWLIDHERNVAWGKADSLPEWGDWVERAKNGLFALLPGYAYLYAVSFVAAIPLTGVIIVATAGMVASSVSTGASAPPGPQFFGFVALLWLVTFVWMLALMTLTLPLYQVPEANYALYRDLRAAFQLKLTWRQIRAGGERFRRAWGFGALWITIVLLVILLPMVPMGLALPTIPSGGPSPVALTFAVVALAVGVVLYVAAVLLGVPAALVQAHLWGEWAREAYDLENAPRRSEAAAEPSEVEPAAAE